MPRRPQINYCTGLVACFSMLTLLLLPALSSASQITILPREEIINLGPNISYLADPTGSLTLSDFRSTKEQHKLIASTAETPSFGFTGDTYWFQTKLVHNGNQNLSRTLVISYPLLDEVTVYLIRTQGHITRFETGDTLKFEDRPEPHRFFTFPIDFQPRETITLVVQTTTTSSMQVPMELWISEKLHHNDKEALLAQGIYYGIMLIMVIYNFFIFLVVRRPSYIYYVVYVGAIAGFQAALNGVGYQFLWPDNPWIQQAIVAALIPIITCSSCLFSITLLQTKIRTPKSHTFLIVTASVTGLLALASPFIPYAILIKPNIVIVILGITVLLNTGIIGWRSGFEVAKYFTLAWMAFIAGVLMLAVNKLGIVPRNFITEHGMQIGSVLEVSLLSFALAYRMNTLQAEKIAAEQKSQELQGALNTELKTKLNIFSSVAHELNNPLNYVSVGTQNLRRQVAELHTIVSQLFEGTENNPNAMAVKRALDKTFNEHSQTLEDTLFGAQRAADVVAEMRGLTEVDGKLLRTTDPKDLIDAALRRARDILSPQKFDQVNIDYDYDEAQLEVEVNPYLITHALTNILTNAVRYALTQNQDSPQVHLHAHMLDDMVHMVIANNGEPIPTDLMEKIFDDKTSENPITNLSVSRSLIRQQGGELKLLQAGTHTSPVKFEVKLPKSNPESEPPLMTTD